MALKEDVAKLQEKADLMLEHFGEDRQWKANILQTLDRVETQVKATNGRTTKSEQEIQKIKDLVKQAKWWISLGAGVIVLAWNLVQDWVRDQIF